MTKFEEVLNINVNDKTEKKGVLKYLSWSWAWAEFKKVYPEATYKIKDYDGLYCTGNEKIGYMVSTSVTAGGLTYDMWLPVMDMRNKTIFQPNVFEINKTIMRCFTKNLAMFGLGLYIYAGEDLPEEEQSSPQSAKQAAKTKAEKFEPLTKTELVQKWGVTNAEATIQWFEKQFKIPFKDWDAEVTECARAKLEEKKQLREAKQKAAEENADIPFPMTD